MKKQKLTLKQFNDKKQKFSVLKIKLLKSLCASILNRQENQKILKEIFPKFIQQVTNDYGFITEKILSIHMLRNFLQEERDKNFWFFQQNPFLKQLLYISLLIESYERNLYPAKSLGKKLKSIGILRNCRLKQILDHTDYFMENFAKNIFQLLDFKTISEEEKYAMFDEMIEKYLTKDFSQLFFKEMLEEDPNLSNLDNNELLDHIENHFATGQGYKILVKIVDENPHLNLLPFKEFYSKESHGYYEIADILDFKISEKIHQLITINPF